MIIKNQLQIEVNFLWEIVHNLDGIELGNNEGVTFLQEIFHMVRDDHFRGARMGTFEGVFMTHLIESLS
jgi:hypothetical protein